MIRGRAEKRTDPAVIEAEKKFSGAKTLKDVIRRIEYAEGIGGCCHQTVLERCEGCPYATVNS